MIKNKIILMVVLVLLLLFIPMASALYFDSEFPFIHFGQPSLEMSEIDFTSVVDVGKVENNDKGVSMDWIDSETTLTHKCLGINITSGIGNSEDVELLLTNLRQDNKDVSNEVISKYVTLNKDENILETTCEPYALVTLNGSKDINNEVCTTKVTGKRNVEYLGWEEISINKESADEGIKYETSLSGDGYYKYCFDIKYDWANSYGQVYLSIDADDNNQPELYADLQHSSWWNETFLYRRAINISNVDTDDTLIVGANGLHGYTLNLTVDTATLITEGKMGDYCEDLRIVCSGVEMDRVFKNETIMSTATSEGCNQATSQVMFMHNSNISASSSNSTQCYMYYGNTTNVGVAPKNMTNIFLSHSTFTAPDGVALPDGWIERTGSDCSIDTNRLKVAVNSQGCYMNLSSDNVYVPKWEMGMMSMQSASADGSQRFTLQNKTNALSGTHKGILIVLSKEAKSMYIEREDANVIVKNAVLGGAFPDDTYHYIVQQRDTLDYQAFDGTTKPPTTRVSFGVTNDTGSETVDVKTFNLEMSRATTYIDDVFLRRFVENEPIVTALSEERTQASPVIDYIVINTTSTLNLTNGTIQIYVNVSDTDGGTLMYGIDWWKNNVIQPTQANATSIDASFTTKHDNWTAIVYATDNTSRKATNKTGWVYINNAQPGIPQSYDPNVTYYTHHPTALLECSGSEDIDGDALNYEFWVNLTDLVIQQNSTETTYNHTFNQSAGEYNFNCRANDQETAGRFFAPNVTLNYTINYPPEIVWVVLNTTSTLNYTNGTIKVSNYSIDVNFDNFSTTIKWLNNSVEMPEFINMTEIDSANTSRLDIWTVIFNFTDFMNTSEYRYNITIRDFAPTTPSNYQPNTTLMTWINATTFNCSGSTDIDPEDTVVYEFWAGNDSNFTQRQFNVSNIYNFKFEFENGTYLWNCRANDSLNSSEWVSASNISLEFNNSIFFDEKLNFTSPILSGQNGTYRINISWNHIRVNNLSANLTIFGNTIVGERTDYDVENRTEFYVSYFIPFNLSSYQQTGFWNVTLDNKDSEINEYFVYSFVQNITGISLTTSCTFTNGTEYAIVNLSSLEEQNNTYVPATIEGNLQVWLNSLDQDTNISLEFKVENVNTTMLCLTAPNNYTIYKSFGQIRYEASGHDPRDYYFIRHEFTNITQNVSLYSLPITLANGIDFSVQDEAGNALAGYYISVQRYDVGNDSYKTIAMGKSDDDGNDYIFLRKFDVFYKFIIQNDTEIKFTSENRKVSTDTLVFTITEESYSQYIDEFNSVSSTLSYNNVTKVFSSSFSNTGTAGLVCLNVLKLSMTNNTVSICDTCSSGTVGTLTCNISTYGNGTYTATAYMKGSPEFVKQVLTIVEGITNEIQYLSDEIGLEGLVVVALIFVTITTTVVVTGSAPLVVLMGLFTFLIFSVLGFMSLSIGIFTGIMIAGGIVLSMLRK